MENSQAETTEWCAGMPLRERRPLQANERSELEREARSYRRRGLLTVVLMPVLVVVSLAWVDLAEHGLPISEDAAIALSLVSMLATLAFGTLLANDWFGAVKLVRRDLRAGTVSHFAPLADAAESADGARSIEVLDGSDRLWRKDGGPARRRPVLPRTETARTPGFAAIAAQWVQSIAPEHPDAPHVNEREMDTTERAELDALVHRLRWENWLIPALLNVWVLALAVAAIDAGRRPDPDGWPMLAVLVVVTAMRDYEWVRRLRTASLLARDARVGRIVIARLPVVEGATPCEPAPGGESPTLSAPEEFLPHSRALWTVDGIPAPWRRATQVRARR